MKRPFEILHDIIHSYVMWSDYKIRFPKPGAIIKRLSFQTRDDLKALTSDDLKNVRQDELFPDVITEKNQKISKLKLDFDEKCKKSERR